MFNLVPMNRREMGLIGQMGELLNDPFFKNFGRNDQTFMVDIEDRGDAYILEAELPGMKKEEIDISIDGAPAVNPFPPNLDPSQYNPLTNPGKIVDDEPKERDETR